MQTKKVRQARWAATGVVACSILGSLADARAQAVWGSEAPQVQTHCSGVPVKRFGFCWVLDGAPTLLDDAPYQLGNAASRVKVHPKESGAIAKNYLGVTTTRMPRTTANDYLPLEAVQLIDGDPQTCWMSRSQTQPDAQPVWIRLDFPVEQEVCRVVLRKRPASDQMRSPLGWGPIPGAAEVGRGVPASLSIKGSRDGRTWATLYDGPAGDATNRAECAFTFAAVPVKQLWITAGALPLVENILYAFSLAELEVYDARGDNVALVSRGTGITVSSTYHSPGQELAAHRWYWPLHYNAGFKWARIGYHDDPINWHWVEKSKGVFEVDPAADAAVTELASNGVNVVMALNFGNRLYSGPSGRAVPQLWEWNYDMPAPPTTPEALAAWTRYVEFMVAHFRGRVHTFEVWNEWNIPCYWGAQPNVEHYLAVSRAAIPVLRRLAPEARVMMGSWAGFPHGISGWKPEERENKLKAFNYLQATRALASEVDEIGWHPFYQTDPERLRSYTADVKALQRWLGEVGFKGHCMVTEWNYSALYPEMSDEAAAKAWCGKFRMTEMEKAKTVAQVFARHAGLGLESFFCEMYFPQFGVLDLSLLRRSFDADPIPPLQPQAAFYVARNLATMMEGFEPAEFRCAVSPQVADLEVFTFDAPGGRAVALWRGGRARDRCEPVPVTLRVAGPARSAAAFDPVNGVSQNLLIQAGREETTIADLLVGDAPLIVRVNE